MMTMIMDDFTVRIMRALLTIFNRAIGACMVFGEIVKESEDKRTRFLYLKAVIEIVVSIITITNNVFLVFSQSLNIVVVLLLALLVIFVKLLLLPLAKMYGSNILAKRFHFVAYFNKHSFCCLFTVTGAVNYITNKFTLKYFFFGFFVLILKVNITLLFIGYVLLFYNIVVECTYCCA